MQTCPQCGEKNPEYARFCLACGAALAAPEPGREERKRVSVLFADLVGFTSRAVRAALSIREAIGADEDLQVRIAITTGEALVSLGARLAEGEGMASGDVVNTASRLQSSAPADGILVDETTYRATAPSIEYRDAEPVQAKGKAEPIPVWEAVEPRWRF